MNINATLIGQSIAFFMFVWFCMKYVWPPIMQALEARKDLIAEGLASAERGQKDGELAKERAKETLTQAKQQASEIISQAQSRANDLVEESKSTARDEGEKVKKAAQADIDLAINSVREQLQQRVSVLAISAAEKILEREVNAKDHESLLATTAKQL